MALINQSGTRGLSAFLPDKDRAFAIAESVESRQPPHLPLADDWRDANFTMASVMRAAPGPMANGEVDVRTWTQLLLSRYLYMSGEYAIRNRTQSTHDRSQGTPLHILHHCTTFPTRTVHLSICERTKSSE